MKYSATKIIATLGPSTAGEKAITALIRAGVNIFRLNFSHGDFGEHERVLTLVRRISNRLGLSVGILQDLPGPKIRIGAIPDMILKRGERLDLNCGRIPRGSKDIPVNYARLCKELKRGDIVYLNDGSIRLKVVNIAGTRISSRVEIGGPLSSHKGLNLPNTKISLPSLTAYDRKCLEFGLKHSVDFIAMSFVRSANDIRMLKRFIKSHGGDQFIIAKIEKKEALGDFGNILSETDGVMVARGDLGIEIPIEEVPGVQKTLIAKCNRAGVPVITATQVLESMINNPRPTRAEATDAANAILDGTDALMLSGETAVGKYPTEAVKVLKLICAETEKRLRPRFPARADEMNRKDVAACLARSVCETAQQLGIKTIATPTRSGHTARLISRFRPAAKIIAFSQNNLTRTHLLLSWGVQAFSVDQKLPFDKLLSQISDSLQERGIVKKGERVIITAGSASSKAGETNLMVVETV